LLAAPFEQPSVLAADGDVRRALRAILVENVRLEAELRHLYAASAHGKPSDVNKRPKVPLHP
jgi:hypothetical protein